MRKRTWRLRWVVPAAFACAATAHATEPQFPALEPPAPQAGAELSAAYQPPPVPPPAAGAGEVSPPATGTGETPPRLPETTIEGGRTEPGDQLAGPATPAPPQNNFLPPARTPAQVFNDTFNPTVEGNFLPDVEGTSIFGGKKTVNIDLQDRPPVVNNNLRQAFQQTPGLIIAEESTPLVSIGYRGLPPDRAQYMQVLKDGIPIHADMFGYPESYYVPALQTIERIEFVHGGSALMYGPQPGGSLNFITKSPDPNENFEAYTENIWGSNDFFSTYTSLSGSPGPLSYYGYFHHRETAGFRQANSQVQLNYGGAKFITRLSPTEQVVTGFDLYQESHGVPGGLSREAYFDRHDRTTTTRFNDRFQYTRYAVWSKYQAELDEDLFFQTSLWYTYIDRDSRTQAPGTSPVFGGGPTSIPANGATTVLQQQLFHTLGIEPRVRRDWGDESQHTWTYGAMFYHCDSPRNDSTSPNVAISNFIGPNVTAANERETNYLGLFTENRFVFDRLTITPGMRLENIFQSVTEGVNVAKTTAGQGLANDSLQSFAPLFGLGATYQLTDNWLWYGNVSQSYRPPTFAQAIPTGAGVTVAGNLEEGKSYQAEVGLRANVLPYLTVDMSAFYMDFNNQIGTVGTVITNVGSSYYRGGELAIWTDLTRWHDERNNTNYAESFGSINVFYNSMWLDAEFYQGTSAATQGKNPAYAPNYAMRGGVEWQYGDTAVRLAGSWLDSQFGNDNNQALFFIPAYDVWDLTARFQLTEQASVVAGINNVFDEFYTARINANGIDPTNGRNYYLGFQAGY